MSHLLAHFCFYIGLLSSTVVPAQQDINTTANFAESEQPQLAAPAVLSDAQQKEYTDKLARIRTLVRANVVNLAENLLVEDAPPPAPTELWFAWQQQLWALYESTQNWPALLTASENVPSTFPEHMQLLALQKRISAMIELEQYKPAREIIRRQVLVNSQSGISLKTMRQLLIESYLKAQQYADADAAMQLYEAEYRNNDVSWFRIKARLLIQQGQYNEAINALAPYSDPLSDLIKMHARVLNGDLSGKPMQNALAEYTSGQHGISLAQYAHEVLIQGAKNSAENETIIVAIEQYLAFLMQQNNNDTAQSVNAMRADLLVAYSQQNKNIANAAGLFIDDAQALYEHLQNQKYDEVSKRAVLAQVLQNSESLNLRRQSANQYVSSLTQNELSAIVPVMFVEDAGFGRLYVDADTQLTLVNQALATENFALAAFVGQQVSEVPQGVDEDLWLLQNARIAILTNDLKLAKQHLDKWFNRHVNIAANQADQVVQPLFDLQKVGQHKMAIPYFKRLLATVASPRHQREVSFWLAESYEATEKYSNAADYYLSSALMRDNGFDQWGEAARFRAAECLLNEGLYADARNLFETLLARTDNPQRQNQLKQKIQELQLRQSAQSDNNRL